MIKFSTTTTVKSLKCFLFISVVILTSCSHRIADLTMISTRNIDSKTNYKQLASYKKGTDRALNRIWLLDLITLGAVGPLGTPNLENAVEKAVKQVEGGEYMTNVTIREKHMWFLLFSMRSITVEGDIWGTGVGTAKHEITKTPIKAGDEVMWSDMSNKIHKGKVTKVIDGHPVKIQVLVENNGKEKLKTYKIDKVTKVESPSSTPSTTTTTVNEPIKPVAIPPITDKEIYKVVPESLSMRSGPASATILLQLPKGAFVELIEKTNATWWKVKYHDEIGYVSSKFLSK